MGRTAAARVSTHQNLCSLRKMLRGGAGVLVFVFARGLKGRGRGVVESWN